ncbi:MAG: HlyD family efflux transporter periplasmic adaptor subunit [Propionivibrio sp.]
MRKLDARFEQVIPVNTRADACVVFIVILVALGGFFAWAWLAELEAGAIAAGEVIPAGRVRTVQHPEGGLIKAINVRDGDRVKAGDELIVLDDAEFRAAIDIADRDLVAYLARLTDIDREIEGWLSRSRTLKRIVENSEEEAEINQVLYEKKYVSRPRLLQLESQRAQAEALVGENTAELARARQKKSEIEAAASSTREKRSLAQQGLERTRLVSPQDGIVNNLRYSTVGGVLPPGGVVLDLVPDQEELVIEAKISPDDIDVVYPGLSSRVRLTAYKARSHITLRGTVASVSGTTYKDEPSHGRPYYKAWVKIGADELSKIDRGLLSPGMLAEVSIVSGRRPAYRYLIDPILDSFGRAFHES